MNLFGYIPESVNEGTGLRAVLFISGCRHACPGCFSPDSWSFRAGEPFTEERQQQILQEVTSHPLLDGVTLCGDPFSRQRNAPVGTPVSECQAGFDGMGLHRI